MITLSLKKWLFFITATFIRIFKCISLPIIALSIIVTLISPFVGKKHPIWRLTITYTLSTTLIAAIVSALLYVIIDPALTHQAIQPTQEIKQMSYMKHVLNIIPTSLLSPFLKEQVIGVLLLAIVIGMAIRLVPDEAPRQTLIHFFKGLHGLFMVITRWVITIIPIGLYGFITNITIEFHHGMNFKALANIY